MKLFVTLKLAVGVALICHFASSSLAQNDPKRQVQVSVVSVDEPACPVHIASIKHERGGKNSQVVLKNNADKPVTGVRFHLAVTVPKGCSSEPHPVTYSDNNSDVPLELQRVEGIHLRPVAIGPQQQATTITTLVPSDSLFDLAVHEKSLFLQVQFALEIVQFSDGTEWHAPPHKGVFDSKSLQADEERCRDVLATTDKSTLAELPSRVVLDTSLKTEENERGFTFSCHVQNGEAICPP